MIEIARVQIPICGVLEAPEEKSTLLSQLLYGEYCEVLERKDYYAKVRTASDDTMGWVFAQNIEVVDTIPVQYTLTQRFWENEKRELLSIGAELLTDEYCEKLDANHLGDIALRFLHTPFLLGGRSIFGIDAAGFSQLVYKCCGVHLPRTAALQAERGVVLDFIEESLPGDLAFFENEAHEITHVGLMLENQQIIHAFGKVRIDDIDSVGIYNASLKRHTHKLRFVKRIADK